MSEMKKLSAYLPDPVFEGLEKWAERENRSLSNLAGFLLERALRDEEDKQARLNPPTKGDETRSP
jgi:hypothetical protein